MMSASRMADAVWMRVWQMPPECRYGRCRMERVCPETSAEPQLRILRLGSLPDLEMELIEVVDGVNPADDLPGGDLVSRLHGNGAQTAVE